VHSGKFSLPSADLWPARAFDPIGVREFYITAMGYEDGFAPHGLEAAGRPASSLVRCAAVELILDDQGQSPSNELCGRNRPSVPREERSILPKQSGASLNSLFISEDGLHL
jgi:hypothetical protein